MFIRKKTINSKEYAYLVKNNWSKRKKSSRQKTQKYLGPIHKLKRKRNVSLKTFLKIKDLEGFFNIHSYDQIIINLILLELHNHNFKKLKTSYIQDNLKVNLNRRTLLKDNKKTVFQLNEGFLCNYTINRLLNPKFKSKENIEKGKQLANLLLETGIKADQEVFVNLFFKLKTLKT